MSFVGESISIGLSPTISILFFGFFALETIPNSAACASTVIEHTVLCQSQPFYLFCHGFLNYTYSMMCVHHWQQNCFSCRLSNIPAIWPLSALCIWFIYVFIFFSIQYRQAIAWTAPPWTRTSKFQHGQANTTQITLLVFFTKAEVWMVF